MPGTMQIGKFVDMFDAPKSQEREPWRRKSNFIACGWVSAYDLVQQLCAAMATHSLHRRLSVAAALAAMLRTGTLRC